jgi:hypothetical protein
MLRLPPARIGLCAPLPAAQRPWLRRRRVCCSAQASSGSGDASRQGEAPQQGTPAAPREQLSLEDFTFRLQHNAEELRDAQEMLARHLSQLTGVDRQQFADSLNAAIEGMPDLFSLLKGGGSPVDSSPDVQNSAYVNAVELMLTHCAARLAGTSDDPTHMPVQNVAVVYLQPSPVRAFSWDGLMGVARLDLGDKLNSFTEETLERVQRSVQLSLAEWTGVDLPPGMRVEPVQRVAKARGFGGGARTRSSSSAQTATNKQQDGVFAGLEWYAGFVEPRPTHCKVTQIAQQLILDANCSAGSRAPGGMWPPC